jgi:putative membrane protein
MTVQHKSKFLVLISVVLAFAATTTDAVSQQPGDIPEEGDEAPGELGPAARAGAVFMPIVMVSGLETEIAHVAVDRAQSAAIRQHAQELLDAHKRADDQLLDAMSGREIELPVPASVVDEFGDLVEDVKTQLEAVPQDEFADAYLETIIVSHEAAIEALTELRTETEDPVLLEQIDTRLQILQDSLDEARELHDNLDEAPTGDSTSDARLDWT